MKDNKQIIHQFFKGECDIEQLHEAHRLFGTKELKNEVLDYLEEEWENFDENEVRLSPVDFENLYKRTKKKSGLNEIFTLKMLKIAASVVLISSLSILTYWQLFSSDLLVEMAYNEVTTQRGETKIVELSDGSKITMNAASKLRYPKKVTEENRNIFIEGGAYFQVNKQLASLLIHIDEIKAEVRGASFNVSAYHDEDEIVIAVEKGGSIKTIIPWVNLYPATPSKGADARQQSNPIDENSSIALIVNEEEYFSYSRRIRKFEQDKFEESREHFAWVDGKVFFNEIGVEKMLKQLSRTFDLDFGLSGCIDEKMTFSGEYDRNSLTAILNHTSEVMDAEYAVNEHRIAITGNCN